MRAERFGSYWIESTLAGTPSLLRRKSIRRYARLCPPPRCREVILPWLLRPLVRTFGRSSDFSGLAPGVSSAKSLTVAPRRPGVVGLYLRIPMVIGVGGQRLEVRKNLTSGLRPLSSLKRNQSCVLYPT